MRRGHDHHYIYKPNLRLSANAKASFPAYNYVKSHVKLSEPCVDFYASDIGRGKADDYRGNGLRSYKLVSQYWQYFGTHRIARISQ